MVGTQLNHYEITARLGQGGMGEVFVAQDTRLNRKVALKVTRQEVAADADRRARFEREAQAVAALNHPNIVTIHSVEEGRNSAGAVLFITMELVEGRTLTELLPRNGFALNKLLEIAVPLADAVSTAHRAGITHRDLKPDNVMIDANGRLRVLDFGLAKLSESTLGDSAASQLATKTVATQEGKILGTVAYMSPEQAEGKPVDERTDVFSLGTMLYQLATGRQPFQGDTSMSTISSILRDDPQPIAELNASLPRDLGRIVRRCLAKAPDRRYQTALDLRNELEELKRDVDSGEIVAESTSVAPFRRPRTWGFLALAAGVLIAATLLVARFAGGGLTRPETEVLNMRRLMTQGEPLCAAISPDGRMVAHANRGDEGGTTLWLTQISTMKKLELVTTDETIDSVTFVDDGEFVNYEIGDASYSVSLIGGHSTRLSDQVATGIV